MILRQISLENFGLYAGRQELDLAPRGAHAERPIVLVGGRNGAGKTTLLEAIRLALYGRRALGARVAQAEYEQYLRRRVHVGEGTDTAAVALRFDYAEDGEVHLYDVRRSWRVSGRSVEETLVLEKDGEEVRAVPREEWHLFLLDLIPPGVSQLFFFDGEKIQEMAEGDDADGQLAEAVRGLLGVELVTRLRDDLALYYGRQQRLQNAEPVKQIEDLKAEMGAVQDEVARLEAEIVALKGKRNGGARNAERIRRRFVAEGGDAARNRGRLEATRDHLKRQIGRGIQELRGMANGLLPFLMAPKVMAGLSSALVGAGEGELKEAADRVGRALREWQSGGKGRSARWDAQHWKDLFGYLEILGAGGAPASTSPALAELGDGKIALTRLREAEIQLKPRAAALGAELQSAIVELRHIEDELARADHADTGVLLQELLDAEQALTSLESTLRAREEDARRLRGRLVTLSREYERALEGQTAMAAATGRGLLAARVSKVLATYEKRLLELKLTQLSEAFAECFNLLHRKGDLLSGVQIDPQHFTPTLLDRAGRPVPKSALSAGEKQIFAIAMLWALARTSGRPLPMVIDTPLARLDSEHRSNLVERYFPSASHQVVLLSTDTEVDQNLYEALADNVSHAYRLDYLVPAGRTVVSEGYFAPPTEEVQGALQQA